MNLVATVFREGGPFMYVILLFGILTLGFIVERAIALFVKTKQAPADFRKRVLEYISRGDLKGAENYANSAGANTAIGRVASLGCYIRSNAGGEEEVQARMDEKLAEEVSTIDQRNGFLAMFGNVATLLGLLGTITGMIHSFAAVAAANPMDRATLLSKGISEAMNCTAFGLIVAIPALVAFAVFQNRTDRIVAELTEGVTQIYHDLLFLTESDNSVSASTLKKNLKADSAASMSNAPQMSV